MIAEIKPSVIDSVRNILLFKFVRHFESLYEITVVNLT
jgi:hypothetical protein